MNPDELVNLITSPFTFRERPTPIDVDYRPSWRMGIILIALLHSRGTKSSLLRLQLIDWALRNPEHQESLINSLGFARHTSIGAIVPGKTLLVCLEFLVARDLVAINFSKSSKSSSYILSEQGKEAATWLMEIEDVFVQEKQFVNAYGLKITEQVTSALVDSMESI